MSTATAFTNSTCRWELWLSTTRRRSSDVPIRPPVTEYDLSMYLRPSRYAEADKFFGFAATEFGNYLDSATLLEELSLWVGARLNYVPGSSDPIDGAVDTLLAGAGVCRDFAHLVVACCERSTCRRESCRCMRRVCTRWTSTPWPRPTSKGSGEWSTGRFWRPVRPWCA